MTLQDLKAQRDELNQKIEELEREALADLEAKAREFGLHLTREEPKKTRRKRRTKQEMLEAAE